MGKRIEIHIEEYIRPYEEGKISVEEIAKLKRVCVSTINDRLNEYYDTTKKKRPEFRKGTGKKPYEINIKPYIEQLKEGKITKKAIADKEGVSVSLINVRIREYCTKNKIKNLNLRQWNGRKIEVDVAPHIKNLKEGKTTKKEIVHKLGISIPTLKKCIKKRYKNTRFILSRVSRKNK